MKKIFLIIIFSIIVNFTGCSKAKLTNTQFNVIWKIYQKNEFQESFKSKIDTKKRQLLLNEICEKYKIDYYALVEYMNENEIEKYNIIFK